MSSFSLRKCGKDVTVGEPLGLIRSDVGYSGSIKSILTLICINISQMEVINQKALWNWNKLHFISPSFPNPRSMPSFYLWVLSSRVPPPSCWTPAHARAASEHCFPHLEYHNLSDELHHDISAFSIQVSLSVEFTFSCSYKWHHWDDTAGYTLFPVSYIYNTDFWGTLICTGSVLLCRLY